MLLSFKHQPTLTICDIPSFVANHGNKRQHDMFWPNKGRFTDTSVNNLRKLAEGHLKVSLPELDITNIMLRQTNDDHAYSIPVHPLTHTRNHYVAYDRFHEENTSIEFERLRHLDLVPECASINSEVVEELFSLLNRSKHFLTQMKPVHHVFVVRLLCHFNNKKINQKRLDVIQKKLNSSEDYSLTTASDGRIVVSGKKGK